MGLFTCGLANHDRGAMLALASLGKAALPELEAALDSLEAAGNKSPYRLNSHELLEAYARIRGREALPRLERIRARDRWTSDRPIPIALGLTAGRR
ncbi:MAG: hypothetical protein U0Q16_23295 [Bryobacteraceae bacterium]